MAQADHLITDFPVVEVAETPIGMTAYLAHGQIVFWDGRRQYHTGATVAGPELRRAMKHHFDRS